MKKREDLRVVKTKANLKGVLKKLLRKKPIRKITVTELAREAVINKGTFYLHYSDIYDLYEEVILEHIEGTLGNLDYYMEFFTNPKMFVKKFLEDFDFGRLEKTFPYLHEDEHKLPLPLIVTNTLSERLMSTGLLEDTMKNKVKLTVALSCITEPFIQMREEADLICEIAGEVISNMF